MKKIRLLWQIYPSYLLIIILALLLASWATLRRTERLYRHQLDRDLRSQAILLGQSLLAPDGRRLPDEQIAALCDQLGEQLPIRLTVIAPDGVVIGDSDDDPKRMENHLRRPEVQSVLKGKPQSMIRYSNTVAANMLYMAWPLYTEGELIMLVRVALPYREVEEAMQDAFRRLAGVTFLVLLFAAWVGLHVSKRLTQPLSDMRSGALRFSRGDLGHRLPLAGSGEMADLSAAMNQMAEQLERRLDQVSRERNTRQAVFDSMMEGLLAVDRERRVIHINRAAVLLLDLEGREVKGVALETVIRNSDLQKLLSDAAKDEGAVEGSVEIPSAGGDRLLAIRGTALHGGDGECMGALVVMQDKTRVRHLEQMRQDFVANVSHELKTPITSIMGFVETLQDGAAEDPQSRNRFLEVIARQARHLDAIVADLLLLSAAEHESRLGSVPLERVPLRPVLEAAVGICRVQAESKQIRVEIDVDSQLMAYLSPHLFEQALVNLIDNAIKYSTEKSLVSISAAGIDHEIIISVRDTGPGIERLHLDRIFERFYRVDKGRSRQMGGTGLGLSIVKHIVAVHKGRVDAESRLGEGSVFRIRLPVDDPRQGSDVE